MRALFPALILAACAPQPGDAPGAAEPVWGELDHPLPPPGVPLVLDAGDPVSGEVVTLTVTDADPGETVGFFLSRGPIGVGPCPAQLGGECLDLGGGVRRIAGVAADATGVAAYDFVVPPGLAIGGTVTFQATARRGAGGVDSVVSNPIERVIEAPAWESAITVDGSPAEWTADELFATTSGVGAAGVGWDGADLYVLLQHPDVGASALHWMHVYLSDGDGAGAVAGVQHGTQEPALPFAADHLVRLKADGSYDSLESWDGAGWVGTPSWLGTAGSEAALSVADAAVELRIPRSVLGSDLVEVHISWAYEGAGFESTYAGTPSDSFVDGYDVDFGSFLTLDLASPDSPVTQNP